jgi:DNA-binding response OmpR family regulator
MVLKRVLSAIEGVTVFEAPDGEQAWAMLQGGLAPDLCFLDINMPRTNGLQLLGMIRRETRHAAVRVCICSAVRTREVIVEAANLRPDYYLLKPFTKADVLAQVQKSRELTGIAAPEEVCRKNGLSKAEYLDELRALMNELRSLQQSSTNRIFTRNYLEELVALERIMGVASKFGAVRILELITQMTQVTKEARELPAEPAKRSYGDMFQILQDIQREAARLEHQVSRIAVNLSEKQENKSGTEEDDCGLAQFILKVFHVGRILAPNTASQSKTLSIPIRATKLGESTTKTAGAITRRQTFTLSILDDDTMSAIEDCRKIGNLTRLLSFRLGEKINWASEAAILLLNAEVAAKNQQGILLLSAVVGPDLDTFLESKKITIHESLARTGAVLNEREIQDIIADLRARFQRVLGGQLTAQPVFSTLSIGDLQGGADEHWAMPYALLRQSALLFRTAASDPGFNRELTFNTFDREKFLQAMNVIEDPMERCLDRERAIGELKEIKEIEKTSATYRRKCARLLALIRGRSGTTKHNGPSIPPDAGGVRPEVTVFGT